MSQETRQELLVSLLKKLKDFKFEGKKQLAEELYMSVGEFDDFLYELIKERSFYVKTRTF